MEEINGDTCRKYISISDYFVLNIFIITHTNSLYITLFPKGFRFYQIFPPPLTFIR